MVGAAQFVLAQTSAPLAISGKSVTELKEERLSLDTILNLESVFSRVRRTQPPANIRLELLQLPNTHRVPHYGIFCKWEEEILKASKVPLKFRLGSLDYVNYLEKKNEPSYFYGDTKH